MKKILISILLLFVIACGGFSSVKFPTEQSSKAPEPTSTLIPTEPPEQNCIIWSDAVITKNNIGKTVCIFGVVEGVKIDRMYSLIRFETSDTSFTVIAKGDYANKKDYCVTGNVYIENLIRGTAMPFNTKNTVIDCNDEQLKEITNLTKEKTP